MKQKDNEYSESELYKELGALTKNKDVWEESIRDVYALLKTDFELIKPYWNKLLNKVVRIHSLGAIKATLG